MRQGIADSANFDHIQKHADITVITEACTARSKLISADFSIPV